MMSTAIRLIVPTTLGPSQILYLVREEAAMGRSTICLKGTSQQAGIDREYNAFVRQSSGVVERMTGHAFFRMDVSTAIDAGSSWQLAVLTAHIVEHENWLEQALEKEGAAAGILVWATGTVRSVGLAIGEVGHVPEKLRQSIDLFTQAKHDGLVCHVLIPEGNRADLPTALVTQIEQLGVAFHFVSTFEQIYSLLKIAPPAKARAEAADKPDKAVWHGNPFQGLSSYGPQQRPVFFGRARAREECLSLIRKAAAQDIPFQLIHGRSGVGKSSLMRAGLTGDIQRFASEGGTWTHHDIRLSDQGEPAIMVARSLANEVQQALSDDDLVRALLEEPVAFVDQELSAGGRRSHLLTLDQLEQIYAANSVASLARFDEVLSALLGTGNVWIVATMRTDQMELLSETPTLRRLAKSERSYVLDRPSLSETTEIIVQPLAAAGLRFDDDQKGQGLVSELAEIALKSPDSLPLLQVVLTRMAEMAGKDGIIPVDTYEFLGGFAQTAARWAEKSAAELLDRGVTDDELSRALSELIRIDPDTGQALSRAAPYEESNEATAEIFSGLVAARLAVTETFNDTRYARLAHETLIENWPRLTRLVNDLRGELALRDRVEKSASLWDMEYRPETELLRTPSRLDAAHALEENALVPLSAIASTFIQASLKARDQNAAAAQSANAKRLRRARMTALAAIGAMLVIGGLALWALEQRGMAREQAALAIDNEARALSARVDAEEANKGLRRRLDYEGLLGAEKLVDQGKVDFALLNLLRSSDSFVELSSGGGFPAGFVPDSIPIAFERVLERAALQTTYPIPADAMGFEYRNVLYYGVSSENTLWRFDGYGPPEQIGKLQGNVVEMFDLLPEIGPVLAVEDATHLRFHRFDPKNGIGALLIDFPRTSPEVIGWDPDVGPDGTVIAREILPPEMTVTRPNPFASVYLGHLDTGVRLRLEEPVFTRLNVMNDGTSSVNLSSGVVGDIEAAERLNISVVSDPAVRFSDHAACFGAEAASLDASKYGRVMREILQNADAFNVDCTIAGPHIAMLATQSGSAGFWDTLHLADIRNLDEEGLGETVIQTRRPNVEGISMALVEDMQNGNDVLDFVYHSFQEVTMQSTVAGTETLSMAAPVETAVALGNGRAALIVAPEQAEASTKALVVVDMKARATYGQRDLGHDGEQIYRTFTQTHAAGIAAAETAAKAWVMRADAVESENSTKEFPRVAPSSIEGMIEVTFEDLMKPITIPAALTQSDIWMRLAPSGDVYALWKDRALRVYSAVDGTEIARREMGRQPRDFTFAGPHGPDLMISEGSAVIIWGPSDDEDDTDWTAGILFRSADPVTKLVMSPSGKRMIYEADIGEMTIQTRIYAFTARGVWRTLGRSYKYTEAYFLDDNTVFYRNRTGNYLHSLPNLTESQDLARSALSDHCQFEGKNFDASPCAQEFFGTAPPLR
ncbi:MAG: ATP-binding protein [Sulfitobacter sp.]